MPPGIVSREMFFSYIDQKVEEQEQKNGKNTDNGVL